MAMMEKGTEHTSNDEKEVLAILDELDLIRNIKEEDKELTRENNRKLCIKIK